MCYELSVSRPWGSGGLVERAAAIQLQPFPVLLFFYLQCRHELAVVVPREAAFPAFLVENH